MSRQYTLQRAPISASVHIDYAAELNEQQLAAVTAPPGPILVIAGAGSVRALAVTSAKRSSLLPDIPTVAESGLPGFDATLGYGLLAAAGTPRPIIERLNRELRLVLATPSVLKILTNEGVEPLATTPEEFTTMIDREEPKWTALIKQLGLVAK